MKTLYRKRFLKELARLPPRTRRRIEEFVYEEVPKSKSIGEIRKIEQMRGYPSCYKARFGDYRVGIRIENDQVIFERAIHRKEIYRYFP